MAGHKQGQRRHQYWGAAVEVVPVVQELRLRLCRAGEDCRRHDAGRDRASAVMAEVVLERMDYNRG